MSLRLGELMLRGADVQDLLSPVAYVLNIQPARRNNGDIGPVVSHRSREWASICHMLAADPGLAFDNTYASWPEEHEPRSMLGDEAPLQYVICLLVTIRRRANYMVPKRLVRSVTETRAVTA